MSCSIKTSVVELFFDRREDLAEHLGLAADARRRLVEEQHDRFESDHARDLGNAAGSRRQLGGRLVATTD
jgi:hypothetical protein